MFDLRERFLEQWLRVFALLLQAQASGENGPEVEKLRVQYMRMAELAGPQLTQQFFHEAISRAAQAAPDFAARLLKELLAKGIIQSRDFTMGPENVRHDN